MTERFGMKFAINERVRLRHATRHGREVGAKGLVLDANPELNREFLVKWDDRSVTAAGGFFYWGHWHLEKVNESAPKGGECPNRFCSNTESGDCPRCFMESGFGCDHGPVCENCVEDSKVEMVG